jgi:hypothetical protein
MRVQAGHAGGLLPYSASTTVSQHKGSGGPASECPPSS